MDKMLVQQYRNRWQQVAEIERREQQTASLQQRWLQLNNLRRLAAGLNLSTTPADKSIVWQRWSRLKAGLK